MAELHSGILYISKPDAVGGNGAVALAEVGLKA
jgi:hypothetical protein